MRSVFPRKFFIDAPNEFKNDLDASHLKSKIKNYNMGHFILPWPSGLAAGSPLSLRRSSAVPHYDSVHEALRCMVLAFNLLGPSRGRVRP